LNRIELSLRWCFVVIFSHSTMSRNWALFDFWSKTMWYT